MGTSGIKENEAFIKDSTLYDADKYRKRISMMVEDGVISEKEAEDWM